VAASRFELIAITDADCVVPERWLESINTYFTSDINLLVGAVKIEPSNNFFSKLQAMEFASLIGAGFATLSLGLPTMANGANMAFRKSTFEKVNGYEGTLHIASGDDEHLMHKVAKQFPTTVRVMTTARSVVSTKPKSSLKEFEQQRLRWAAKWKSNQSFFSKSLAVFIFLFQVTYFLALFSLFFTFGNTRELALLLATKWFLEFLFLYAVHLFLNLEWNWISFLILQFVYPLYVMYIAIISFFSPAHVWKDRELY
jgi:cellulose synthase/poly-beta-1,6-N-acetylglucosamine synthase-like glycosyltransferase